MGDERKQVEKIQVLFESQFKECMTFKDGSLGCVV